MATIYDDPAADMWNFDAEGNFIPQASNRPQPSTLAVPGAGSFDEAYQQGAGVDNPDFAAELPPYVPPARTAADLPSVGQAGMDDMAGLASQSVGDPQYQVGALAQQRAGELESRAWDSAEMQAASGAPQAVRVPNTNYENAQQYKANTESASAGLEQAVDDAGAVSFGRDLAMSEVMKLQQREVMDLVQRREAVEANRAQRLEDQFQAAKMTQAEIDKAAKAYTSAPQEDPGRMWASKSAFQKVMLTLSAVAKGWLMGQGFNVDPMGAIKDGVRQDIDAQRSNRALLGEKLNAAERASKGAFDVYNELRSVVSDAGMRDDIIYIGRMRAIEAELAAIQAEAQVGLGAAGADKLLAQVQQEIADMQYKVNLNAAKNPEYFTKLVKPRTVTAIGPDGRPRQVSPAFAAAQATGDAKEARDLRMKGIDVAASGAKDEGGELAELRKEQRAAARSGGKKPIAERRFEANAAYNLAKDTVVDQGVIDAIVGMRTEWGDEVPGFGATGILGRMDLTDLQQKAYYQLVNVLTRSIRPETGAAYSAQEIDNASGGIILEGRTPQDNGALQQAIGMLRGKDEADVMNILDEVELKHRRRIKHLQAPLLKSGVLEEGNLDTGAGMTPRPIEQVDEPDGVEWEN